MTLLCRYLCGAVVVSMLRLRYRWLTAWWPGGSGGFVLMCSSPSEWPISVSAGVVLAESDEIDDFLARPLSGFAASSGLLAAEHSDDGLSSLSESVGRLLALSSMSVARSQDRSTDRAFPNDLRSLSTSRMWNLFRLPWLPDDGLGGEQLAFRVGLVSDACEVRDEVRENAFAL